MMKDIILFGMQGSGKGTQAKLILQERSQYKYLEMGNIFRTLTSGDNIIGNYVKDLINNGFYVDDKVTAALFTAAVYTAQNEPLLIDGFPRKIEQMHIGISLLTQLKKEYVAINFTLSQEEAVKRLTKRAQEQGRVDDTPESIKRRIDQFYTETQPVIDHFRDLGKLVDINANRTIEEIFKDVKKYL